MPETNHKKDKTYQAAGMPQSQKGFSGGEGAEINKNKKVIIIIESNLS